MVIPLSVIAIRWRGHTRTGRQGARFVTGETKAEFRMWARPSGHAPTHASPMMSARHPSDKWKLHYLTFQLGPPAAQPRCLARRPWAARRARSTTIVGAANDPIASSTRRAMGSASGADAHGADR